MTGARLTRRSVVQARARALGKPQARRSIVQAATTPAAAEGEESPSTSTTAELWLYGTVGGWWFGFDAESVAYALRSVPDDVTDVIVRVHSPGGVAVDGIAIGNLFRNHPAKFTAVVDGLAASAASVLILGCDEIVVSPGAQIMIHDASMLTYGNAAQLASDASFIGKISANYAEVYATRGKTAEEWRTAMTADNGRGTYYTGTEAVEAGLADRVGTIQSSTPPPAPPEPDEDFDEEDLEAAAAWDRDVLCHPDAWAAWSSSTGALARLPKPPTASADGKTHTEGNAMSLSDAAIKTLKAKLGVTAEDADEATILAALDEVLDEQTEPTPTASTTTAAVPAGMVLVDAETFASMRDGAQLGAEARAQQLADHRDGVITAAIAAGKFAPARRDHYVKAWTADPVGTEETIKALEPGLVPVAELGHDQTTAGADTDAPPVEALDAFAGLFGLSGKDLVS